MNIKEIKKMNLHEFKPGQWVLYIPDHATGDPDHEDCENGIVTDITELFVFVKYISRGELQATAKATHPKNLMKL